MLECGRFRHHAADLLQHRHQGHRLTLPLALDAGVMIVNRPIATAAWKPDIVVKGYVHTYWIACNA